MAAKNPTIKLRAVTGPARLDLSEGAIEVADKCFEVASLAAAIEALAPDTLDVARVMRVLIERARTLAASLDLANAPKEAWQDALGMAIQESFTLSALAGAAASCVNMEEGNLSGAEIDTSRCLDVLIERIEALTKLADRVDTRVGESAHA